MANYDIENFLAESELNEDVTPTSACPIRHVKSLPARQARPPLEVSNGSNYFHAISQARYELKSEFVTMSGNEHYSTPVVERPRQNEGKVEVSEEQRHWNLHFLDDSRSPSAENPSIQSRVIDMPSSDCNIKTQGGEEPGEETYKNHYAARGPDGCKIFDEIIDVRRESGFGEDEDFDGNDNEAVPSLRERSYCELSSEEFSVKEQYLLEPNFSVKEENPTNFMRLELGFVGGYEYPCIERSNQIGSQVEEGHSEDEVESKPRHHHPVSHNWLTLRSIEQEGQTQRDFWEEERLEVQLEEEVGRWKGKAHSLKNGITGPYADNGSCGQGNPGYLEYVIRDMLAELRVDEGNDIPGVNVGVGGKSDPLSLDLAAAETSHLEGKGHSQKLMIMAFEELLRELDARENKNKKTMDDVLREKEEKEEMILQQTRAWSETEKQLESRISNLELQNGRLSDALRETAVALTLEKERRRDSRLEAERMMEMVRSERKSHQETIEKLNTCVNSLMKLRGNLAMQKSRSAEDGGPSYFEVVEFVLRDMDRELQLNLNNLNQSTRNISELKFGFSDIDEFTRLKQQRDTRELERDQVEEKMSTTLSEIRERHGEMEALWLEREKLLEQKLGCLEVELQHIQLKQKRKEVEILTERQRWTDEMEKCMRAWARERKAWELKMCDTGRREGERELRWESGRVSTKTRGFAANLDEGWGKGSEVLEQKGWKGSDARETNETVHGAAFEESSVEYQENAKNHGQDTEAVLESESEDFRRKPIWWEKEEEEWIQRAEQHKHEMNEMERTLSAALLSIRNLEQEIKAKEEQMEEEKKTIDSLLSAKSAELEQAKESLKSREHDIEVTVQKFTDELKLIDKEVEKERKEREQVMELHFASKRKLVLEIKAKEESWEKELELLNHDVENAENEAREKEKVIEELQMRMEEEKSLRERTERELQREKLEIRKEMEEMLADIWKICEDERIQTVVAKKLLPGEELSLRRPLWASLWLEYCQARGLSEDSKVYPSTIEWESARNKVASLEKQITEAMLAIDSLRDEVKEKEEQLLQVKADRDRDSDQRKEDWIMERENLIHLLDSLQQKEDEFAMERESREKTFKRKVEALEELRKIEREEAAEAFSKLQRLAKELEWYSKHSSTRPSKEEDISTQGTVIKRDFTYSKDQSGYLEEVDRYIFDLESKSETPGRSSRSSEVGSGSEDFGSPRVRGEARNALMQVETVRSTAGAERGPMFAIDNGERYSPRVSREWSSPLGVQVREARQTAAIPLERTMCLTLNGLLTSTQESPWTEGANEDFSLWQPESRTRLRVSGGFNCRSNSWMTDKTHSYPESPTRRCLALPGSAMPTRRSQKWLVDVSWLDQVRKEHAWLRQQLEIERQRVSSLGRVEADNQWIEAAIIRALELKRHSDSKAAEMQQKLAAMEALMTRRNTRKNVRDRTFH